ncbi:hypothetical protein LFJ61_001446 [Clostridium perfringens]|nr:hypothetical protein [Clostridium perfringens]
MNYIPKYEIEKVLESLIENNQEDIKIELDGDLIEYNVILKYIEKLPLDVRDQLHYSATKYKNKISNADDVDNKIIKLLDYVLLEIPRANKFDVLQQQINRSEVFLRDMRNSQRESNERMQSHEQKIEKMQSDFISILSIFSAVIIAFFGGISVLGSVFSNIDKVSKYKLIFMTAIIGFIMFNLIYMLLHSISKITKNRIGVDIEADYCWGCRENYFIKCLATKYPIVFIYNSATIIICIFTFLAYICDKYNFITFIIESVNIIPDKMSFIPVVGCALLAILLFILYLLNKKFSPLKKISCHGNRRTHGCG